MLIAHGPLHCQDHNLQLVGHDNIPRHQMEKVCGPGEDRKICVVCRHDGQTCGERLGKDSEVEVYMVAEPAVPPSASEQEPSVLH